MRFVIQFLAIFVALIAMVHGHTINCAGRAIAADALEYRAAIMHLRFIEEHGGLSGPGGHLPPSEGLEPNTCENLYCSRDTNVRWCNDDPKYHKIMEYQHFREGAIAIYDACMTSYKGRDVSGGVISHPDNWSMIVQKDTGC
ncbi:uncharacterized protein DSM5745_02728 [Aspergillus mulundensis]|uniref:Secreted protein n=1 Tax=Aspergillus mulundensis TaxID=1810919 RepID=A0A3D8SIH1_9EURO|nr:Uncharacterized protein DSM5745_02728 [Aspergillus mulundensis]RDW86086.1 Uncharacterized protein DSM5745_02728 [Aspergillus mulundensis]